MRKVLVWLKYARVGRVSAVCLAGLVLLLGVGPQQAASGSGQDLPGESGPVVLTVTSFASQDSSSGSTSASTAMSPLPSPPYHQCPAVGRDTSCGVLVVVEDGGIQVLSDPSQPPFDGIEDTLIGVQNNSGFTLDHLTLSSNTDLFGFDGDGLCTQSPRPSGCPFGPTGYEGPGTSFSAINPAKTGGVVNFTNGVAAGGSAYFSLEEALTGATVFAGGPSPSEQLVPNPGENQTTNSCRRPVNCAKGVFWHTFADLSVPGRGVSLAFSRTYVSAAAATDGPLGFGWTHSYSMSLATDQGSGSVTVNQENGATVTFSPNGSGGYVAAPRVLATLVHNGDGTYTFTRYRDQIHYTFSAAGALLREVDRNGYTTSLAYDGSGRLTTVTEPAGRTLTFAYSGPHVTGVTDPGGRSETFSYDGSGNLASATDPAGESWSFTYDASHRLLTMTDPRGGVTTNVYDGSGRVISQSDPMDRATTWDYSGDPVSQAGGTTTMTDAKGNQTTFQYQNLELTSATRAAGTSSAATTSFEYDPATLGRTKVTDANGHAIRAAYDTRGNLTSFTDALDRTTTAAYNGFNEPTAVTDPSGVTTTRAYDASGNLTSVSRPLAPSGSQTVTLTYGDPAHSGDVTAVTDPNGNATQFARDSRGDVSSLTDSLGNTSTFVHNVLGELTSSVSPRGNAPGGDPSQYTTSYGYDQLGRLTSVTDPLGHITRRAYDEGGNLISSTDGKDNTTGYVYDADDEVTRVDRADGTVLRYGYDANGNQTSQTDGANHSTGYAYDPLNRVSAVTDPLNRTTSYGYDPAGNLTSLTDPSGRTTSFGYDAANQLTSIVYSDGTTPDVGFSYTANGLRATMSDGTGTTNYSYDSLNRLTSQTNGAGQTIAYGYDLNGNRTSLTYPNGRTVTRSYDAASRLASITDWLGNRTTLTVDPDSNTTAIGYANGVTATSVFDAADQLTSVTHRNAGGTTLASFAYTRDGNGQLTATTPTGAGQGSNESYGYNPLNQLTTVNTSTYAYDAADNLTRLTNGATLAYDAANEVTSYTPAGGPATTLSYDNRGNRLTGLNGATFAYDQANRLTSAGRPGTSLIAGGAENSLAVRSSDGSVWGWGWNAYGQLGDGTTSDSHVPVRAGSLTGVTALTSGADHTLAVKSDGTVWAWGDNGFGQLGNGTTNGSSTPVQTTGISGVTAVAGGNYHSLALKSDGTVWAWGYNGSGQLGNNTLNDSLTPVRVSNLTGAVAIAAGGDASFALKSDGTVWAWGDNYYGQLGNNSTKSSKVPVKVSNLGNVVKITTAPPIEGGAFHVLAVRSDGTVWAWGDNQYGQLGNGTTKKSLVPVQVKNLTGATGVAAGADHSLAVKSDGTVFTWGYNADGELGDGTTTNRSLPVQVHNIGGISTIAAGDWHSLALANDGSVWTWGNNYYGQLGDGTTTNSSLPRQVSSLAPSEESYSYDGDGLRASSSGGGTTKQFAWDLAGSLPLLLSDGQTSYLYDDQGLPIEQIDAAGTVLYLQHDQLGSTRLLTNSAGAVVATFRYDPYGNLAQKTGTADTPLRFAGQYQDPNSGLYYLRARYYDPQTGQFLTRDPIAPLTQQPYAYVGGDPLNQWDPSGLCWPAFACDAVDKLKGAGSAAGNVFASLGTATYQFAKDHPELVSAAITVGVCAGTWVGCEIAVVLNAAANSGVAGYEWQKGDISGQTFIAHVGANVIVVGGAKLLPKFLASRFIQRRDLAVWLEVAREFSASHRVLFELGGEGVVGLAELAAGAC